MFIVGVNLGVSEPRRYAYSRFLKYRGTVPLFLDDQNTEKAYYLKYFTVVMF